MKEGIFLFSKGSVLSNRFKIQKKLGAGGMASVYLARDLTTQKDVALKVMSPDTTSNETLVKRFQREFNVCSSFRHENIIKLYNLVYDRENTCWMYSMEYLPYHDLAHVLKSRKRLTPHRTIDIGIQIARALACFHEKDIVHRDLKPANIMITDEGRCIITDFGLVHSPQHTQLTKTGTVVGTPRYMSPELLSGEQADIRNDIYQTGVILYECLTGHKAFPGDVLIDVAMKVMKGEYLLPSKICELEDRRWDDFFQKCINVDKTKRFNTSADLVTALKALQKSKKRASTEDSPSPASPPKKYSPKRTQHQKPVSIKDSGSSTGRIKPVSTEIIKKSRTTAIKVSIALLVILGTIVLLLKVRTAPLSTGRQPTIRSLRLHPGSESLLAIWTSPFKEYPDSIAVFAGSPQDMQGTLPQSSKQDVPIEPIPPKKSNGEFVHGAIIRRLKKGKTYTFVITCNRSKPVERQFATKTAFPQERYFFTSKAELGVHIAGEIPFRCGGLPEGSRQKHIAQTGHDTYTTEAEVLFPTEQLSSDASAEYYIETLDGERIKHTGTLAAQLSEYFNLVFKLFIEERNIGAKTGKSLFFTQWGKDSHSNHLFENISSRYKAASTDSQKTGLEKELWGTTEMKLSTSSSWYQKLVPVIETLHYPLIQERFSPQLLEKVSMALLPLELFQGTAVSYSLPENKKWEHLTSPDNRPFSIIGQASAGHFATVVDGLCNNWYLSANGQLPCYFIHDDFVPLIYDEIANSPVREFLTRQTFTFDIPEVPVPSAQAFIRLALKGTGAPSKVAVININSSFRATIRPRKQDFGKLRNQWTQKGNYSNMVVLALTQHKHMLIGTRVDKGKPKSMEEAMRQYAETMNGFDNAFPDVKGAVLFHPIPASVLSQGENTIEITVFNGPSSNRDPLIYKSLSICIR